MGAFAFDRVCVFFFACIESIFGLVPLVMRTTAVAFQPRVGSEIWPCNRWLGVAGAGVWCLTMRW